MSTSPQGVGGGGGVRLTLCGENIKKISLRREEIKVYEHK